MDTKPQTPKESLASIKIVYYALVGGQVFFALVAYFLLNNYALELAGKDLKDVFIYIVPLFVVGGFAVGNILFKSKLITARIKPSLSEKLLDYRSALLIRYALLEGPSFLAIMVYLLTGYILFLAMAALVIAMFFTITPSIDRAVNDLELTPNDEQTFKN